MTFEEKLSAFAKLGVFLDDQLRSESTEFNDVLARANQENPWFTDDNIRFALKGVVENLNEKNLNDWTSHYTFLHNEMPPKIVAVIMAGNLPLVGFRDFLAVLMSGHKLLCKLSSKDSVLLKYLAKKLIHIEPKFTDYICFEDHIIKGFDAVIATGGSYAVDHFNQYFQNYPHIIRGHRNSCAILDGTENTEELQGLFEDMFRYFGLGCRNVTKLFVPENYDFKSLCVGAGLAPAQGRPQESPLHTTLHHHHLYQNNLQYQQVVSALNNRKTIDAGIFTLIENSSLTPPISVVHYEYYADLSDVRKKINEQENQIQCIVSRKDVPFGQAQKPSLFDYADGIDTMAFLMKNEE
jgi:hypothetical protein